MKRIVLLSGYALLSLSLITCQNKVNNSPDIRNIIVDKVPPPSSDSNNALLGIWRFELDDNPTFKIEKDSIYYIDQDETYSYKTSKDSIFIFYKDWIYKGVYKIYKGKLIITDDSNISSYIKWKSR